MSRLSNLPPGVTDAMIEEQANPAYDFRVFNAGSVVLVYPLSTAAKAWINDNVSHESWQWMGEGLCIEPRYLANLVNGMREAGLHQEESA